MKIITRSNENVPRSTTGAKSAVAAKKVLIIDSDGEDRRKERISVLKGLGLHVYPALNIEEARSRCKPGRFDLIVIRAAQDPALAVELCDSIREQEPVQPLLLLARPVDPVPQRDFLAPESISELANRVRELLGLPETAGGYATAA
jgi:PleD family two-component response regulator